MEKPLCSGTSTVVMERSVVFVSVRGVAVFVKEILSKSHASRKMVDAS